MKDEIASAVFFITKLVRKKEKLSKHKLDKFAAKLSAILFEKYKNHWYPENPCRGHAFRCIRVNRQAREPLLEQACAESGVELTELSLPEELTLWVDPFEVSCRYGENSQPFSVARFGGKESAELAQQISVAVGMAALDCPSGASSDEESSNHEPRAIPTVSNPNSVYQVRVGGSPWSQHLLRNPYVAEGPHHGQHRGYRIHRATATALGPRLDRYHWVNTKK
uniref:Anti-proliferative protein domain-containing protein n=1 Tax=Malurus cyaneus samueli TaxID=2593467 RepID=A0A8C5TCA0_9PASS